MKLPAVCRGATCFARSSSGYAGRVFARLGGAFDEAWAEPCEAKDAIVSSIAALATEDHPCGNLLRPRGYDLPTPTEAGYAKAGGQEPHGFAYSAVVPTSQRVGTKAGLAKKGEYYIIIVQYSG